MALLLRDVAGLSYTEIADSLEITLATVKWRIYKAREEVALALAREGITFGDADAARQGRRALGPARVRQRPNQRSRSLKRTAAILRARLGARRRPRRR